MPNSFMHHVTINGTNYEIKDKQVRKDADDLKADLSTLATIVRPFEMSIKEYPYQQGYLVENGVFMPTSGTNTQKTTDPIYLEPGNYTVNVSALNGQTAVNYVRAIAVYDANDNCTNYQQVANLKNFTVGSNDSYVRINTQYDTVNVYEIDGEGEAYTKINDDVIILTDKTLNADNKPADSKAVRNLFEKIATVEEVFYLDIKDYEYEQGYLTANGVFNPTTGTNAQKTTNAITLVPGDYIVTFEGKNVTNPVNYVRAIAVYNSNDECTSYQQTTSLNSFTVGDGDSYVRINAQYTEATTYDIKSAIEEPSVALKENVLIPTDSTLTEISKPADAKAVGDALKSVKIDNFYMPYRRPVIAFNFDGEYNKNSNFKALFDQHGKKCGYAIPYTTAFPYTSKDTYLAWQNEGFEIMGHSATAVGTQSSATDEEIRQIVKDTYTTLTGYGFNIHGFVAYQGNAKPVAVEQAQRMYDYGATATNHAGNLSDNLARASIYFAQDPPYKLWRYSMQASTLDQMKAAVDECYNTNGLVLFYGHANASALNNMTIENIDALLTYIEGKGIPILTPYEAIRDFYTVRPQDIVN